MKTRKFNYSYILQGHYRTHGWEDLCAAEQTRAGWKEIRDNRKDYRENEPSTPVRIIRRRELIAA